MHQDLPPPTIVADGKGLEQLLDAVAGQREVAVDTEADSFFNFREKVCLVQLTAGQRDWLIDPLSGLDLRPLGRLFADAALTKVFHDGEYDILILKRDFGFEFKNLFDTRVAEAALGIESPGLAAVLKGRFGIELDKSLQRSNWSARPLSREQISYARLDTHYLLPLADQQRRELDARGRAMIVAGECRRLEALVPAEQVFFPDEFIRIKGARVLDLAAQSRLRELFVLRYELARDSDLPPFKVLGNEVLLALAQANPVDARDLATRVPSFSVKQARRHGDAVLAALERARRNGPLARTPLPPRRDGEAALTEPQFEMHERLKQWRKTRAQREGYDASLVLNRHVLSRLAQRMPRTREELVRIDGLQDWQLAKFGDELVELIGRAADELGNQPVSRNRRWPYRSRGPRKPGPENEA